MNGKIYKIIITPCLRKNEEPLYVNVLDKSIFTNKHLKRLSSPIFKKKREVNNKLEEELTKKIRANSPFKEVWRELIEPNFIVKQKSVAK